MGSKEHMQMASKHSESCSASAAMREMQTEMSRRQLSRGDSTSQSLEELLVNDRNHRAGEGAEGLGLSCPGGHVTQCRHCGIVVELPRGSASPCPQKKREQGLD